MKPNPGTVRSRDGTAIAYEKSGQGPAVILVAAALSDRFDGTKLARLLSDRFTVMKGTQDGRPLPAARWRNALSPTLVPTGVKSEAFFHAGGRSLAALLPRAEHRVLPGQRHGSAVMAPKAFVDEVAAFFAA